MKGYLTHIEKNEAIKILKALAPTKWEKRRGLVLWIYASNRRNREAIRKLDKLSNEELTFGFNNIKPMFLNEIETVMIK